jgi:hypothetical protein
MTEDDLASRPWRKPSVASCLVEASQNTHSAGCKGAEGDLACGLLESLINGFLLLRDFFGYVPAAA